MGRTLNQIIGALPENRQKRIEARYREKRADVDSLRELRQKYSAKAQSEIASALKIKQPSVSKIEQQTDMYLSTLRGYVRAMGGELELTVRLPKGQMVRLQKLGDVFGSDKAASTQYAVGALKPIPARAAVKHASRKAR